MRFTVTDLRLKIKDLNNRLTEHGIKWQLVDAPRYGWQAVDRHRVLPDGSLDGCCNFVGSGTSREVAEACYNWVVGEISRYTYTVLHEGNILASGSDINMAKRYHRDNPGSTFHTFYDGKPVEGK